MTSSVPFTSSTCTRIEEIDQILQRDSSSLDEANDLMLDLRRLLNKQQQQEFDILSQRALDQWTANERFFSQSARGEEGKWRGYMSSNGFRDTVFPLLDRHSAFKPAREPPTSLPPDTNREKQGLDAQAASLGEKQLLRQELERWTAATMEVQAYYDELTQVQSEIVSTLKKTEFYWQTGGSRHRVLPNGEEILVFVW